MKAWLGVRAGTVLQEASPLCSVAVAPVPVQAPVPLSALCRPLRLVRITAAWGSRGRSAGAAGLVTRDVSVSADGQSADTVDSSQCECESVTSGVLSRARALVGAQ